MLSKAHAAIALGLLSGGALLTLAAQGPGSAALQSALVARIQENQLALRQYTWKQRTELQIKGEVKNTRMELVRFDADGELQKTPLGATTPQERRGIRGRILRDKRDETEEYVQRVMQRVVRYLYPSPASLSTLFQKAEVWEGKSETSGTIQVRVKDFVIAGDSLTLYVDAASHKPRKLEVATALDDDPISVVAEYGDLPDGPTYLARTAVNAAKKQIQIKIENFDYARPVGNK